MIYERLELMNDLLAPEGSIYIHMGPAMSYAVEAILREVMGSTGASAIINWKRVTAHGDSKRWGVTHDSIHWRTKNCRFTWNPQYDPYENSYLDT
jgi:hypothetical protein